MKFLAVAVVFAGLLAGLSPAAAQSAASGSFLAQQACPALQSIKKATNPGDVVLVPGTSYKIVAANKAATTYYWIVVPGAEPDYRWVPVTCGSKDGAATPTGPTTSTKAQTTTTPARRAAPAGRTQFILAASWEPAFCEAFARKPECAGETAASFEAGNFALHGLWPQPRNQSYCGVSAADRAAASSGRWTALPPVILDAPTRAELDKVMPGTQSALERHEWTEHGSCYGTDQQRYFADALAAMAALNASPVRALFADNIGKRLSLEQIRGAFDTAFGPGAGQRVRVACSTDGGRRLISELTIGLTGSIDKAAGIGALILAAAPTSGGCTGGIVDPVGLQ